MKEVSKKSFYLMIVGVLSLVVLAGSATFAYFQISVNGSSTITNVNTTIEDGIGVFTINGGNAKLGLDITIDDMANDSTKFKPYEAKTTGGATTASIGTLNKSDANAGRTYTCTFKIVVQGIGLTSANIKDTDLSNITITGTNTTNNVVKINTTRSNFSSTSLNNIKWTDFISTNGTGTTKTFYGQWVTSGATTATANVNVAASINNINGNQNHLEGLSATFNFHLEDMQCTSVKTA